MRTRTMWMMLSTLLGCVEDRGPSERVPIAPAALQAPAEDAVAYPVVEPDDDAAQVFAGSEVQTYALTIAPADLAALNRQPSAEKYVPAVMQVGAHSQRVAVRYKGSVGAFLPPCTSALSFLLGPKVGKCSFKLAFDEYDPEGRFHDLKKLNLHAMTNDPSMLLERLGYSLFRDMRVAAPRAAYVRVTINGQLEGLFLAVEEPDGRFTRSRFPKDGKGNLYKEVWPVEDDAQRYRASLESNKKEGNVDRVLALARELRSDPRAAVAAHLDREYMLRYLAVDRVIMNDDGPVHLYCISFVPGTFINHNYLWYEASQEPRMWLIPWDLDHALGRGMQTLISPAWNTPSTDCACRAAPGGLPTLPAACDPLLETFVEARAEYEATVDSFLNGPFSAAQVDAKLEAWSAQIAPHVEQAAGIWGAPTVAAWRAGIEQLRSAIASFRQHRGYPYP